MPNQRASRAELMPMFKTVSGLRQEAIEGDEKFLAYLFAMTLEAIQERIGDEAPMPSELESEAAEQTPRKARRA